MPANVCERTRDVRLGLRLAAMASIGGRMERAMGIEPTAQAWEAWVLPLYDARLRLILDMQGASRKCRAGRPRMCFKCPRTTAML